MVMTPEAWGLLIAIILAPLAFLTGARLRVWLDELEIERPSAPEPIAKPQRRRTASVVQIHHSTPEERGDGFADEVIRKIEASIARH